MPRHATGSYSSVGAHVFISTDDKTRNRFSSVATHRWEDNSGVMILSRHMNVGPPTDKPDILEAEEIIDEDVRVAGPHIKESTTLHHAVRQRVESLGDLQLFLDKALRTLVLAK